MLVLCYTVQVVTGNDAMVKNGVTQNVTTRNQCITVMQQYDGKSIEVINNYYYCAFLLSGPCFMLLSDIIKFLYVNIFIALFVKANLNTFGVLMANATHDVYLYIIVGHYV